MTQPTILMCPPDYFGIEYEINPWMKLERDAEPGQAQAQWAKLHETLVGVGVEVKLLEPRDGLPDFVFTANAGLVYGNRFVSSRFQHKVRAAESPHFEEWFADHGYTVEHLPKSVCFEGAGDALFCGQTLFAGYRIRSDAGGHHQIAKMLGIHVLPVELVDRRFYHLDTCFCPLAPDEAIYFPDAFDDYGQKVLKQHIPKLHSVAEDDAERFGCNAVVVGKTVILNDGCDKLMGALEDWGYQPIAIKLDEFLKSGGSAKCLTLRLDGEEAAGWRDGAG
ncbi:MAG: dimethylarginine dimethylaminohydrolase family protein [Gemmataceae bacterium]